MELFDAKTKELLCSNYFFDEEFYDLKTGKESFFINRKIYQNFIIMILKQEI